MKKVEENEKRVLSNEDKIKKLTEELEKLHKEADQEFEEKLKFLESLEKEVNEICEKNNVFCGVILTSEDILQIIELAMKTKENIKIPFKIFFNN
jgi:hypothetical protein